MLTEPGQIRGAILTSVSHDLRTPLAAIKAAATSVLSPDVAWSQEAVHSFLESIDHEADRLDRVVTNLLDLSALQAGSLDVRSTVVNLDRDHNAAINLARLALPPHAESRPLVRTHAVE